MSEEKQPQPGEWWQHDEGEGAIYRIHVIGKNAAGQTLFEDNSGNIETIEEHGWHNWHHLPNCTGWDWQPETFPQYITSKPSAWFADGGFLIRHSAEQAAYVQGNGCILPFEWSAFCDGMLRDGYWIAVTRAEAEATIEKPLPSPPAESPDDWVTQDRVLGRTNVDQMRWMFVNGKEGRWIDIVWETSSWCMHGYTERTGDRVEVRCRRKDLPPVPEPPAESPDDWVTQDRVPYRYGIDERRWVSTADERVVDDWSGETRLLAVEEKKHGYVSQAIEERLELRCRRKDLPPMPQQPTAPEPAKTRTVTLQEWYCWDTDEDRLIWSAYDPAKKHSGSEVVIWPYSRPTGNTRTIEVPCE